MAGNLYIFLEGDDDERFFSNILVPLLKRKYAHVRIVPYAEDPPKETKKYIRSIKSARDSCIFSGDLDDAPCVTLRKQITSAKYQVKDSDIIVVCKEIESWYLGGLNNVSCDRIGIARTFGNTATVSKGDFEKLVPEGISKIEFMKQIIERYDIETGKTRNASFKYFIRKWVEP